MIFLWAHAALARAVSGPAIEANAQSQKASCLVTTCLLLEWSCRRLQGTVMAQTDGAATHYAVGRATQH